MPPPRTWTELHNSRHPRGTELQRKLERGHVLTDYQMNSLYAQPTAKWWTQRDAKAGACALRRIKAGHVLGEPELNALRYSSSRLPPIVPHNHSPTRSSALAMLPSEAQEVLGYKQRIALENNVNLPPSSSTGQLVLAESSHALSAPSLLGETAAERLAARTDRIAELERQIRKERRQRRRLERSISEPTIAGGGRADASASTSASAPFGNSQLGPPPAIDAWFERRDHTGRTVYVHLDGQRSTRQRPQGGEVFGMLSYTAESPFYAPRDSRRFR